MGTSGTTDGDAVSSVLEDPTGRRARWMRRAGRVVFVLFLAWLLAVLLGGLGLMPIAGIPLSHVLRPSPGPPPLVKLPTPRRPSASDLRPAIPAKVFAARTAALAHAAGRGTTTPAKALHAKGTTAPGHVKKTSTTPRAHGKATVAPGQVKKTAAVPIVHRKSTTAPGRVKTTTTEPVVHGKSGAARGQTKTTTSTATTTTTTSTTATTTTTKSRGKSKRP